MPISIIILLIVLIAIAFRHVINLSIWIIMGIGALATLLFHQITPLGALKAIEPDVLLDLFGLFLICQAAETSGYLEHLTD